MTHLLVQALEYRAPRLHVALRRGFRNGTRFVRVLFIVIVVGLLAKQVHQLVMG